MNETANYKKYVMRQLGLKEDQSAQFPDKNKYPGADSAEKISPTGRPTPIIGMSIRGSTSGGLPSGADQRGVDISPTKVGGYDRVQPQNLNSKLVNKTPDNPEIGQDNVPINDNPSTGDGVTHPHQIQVTAHEDPQAVTGASDDTDPTLTLKSGEPKSIEVDLSNENEISDEEQKTINQNQNLIPASSLSETFARHKKLMLEKLGLCSCGCKPSECTCKPSCKCGCNKDKAVNEMDISIHCKTCGKDPYDCKCKHPHVPDKMDKAAARILKGSPKKKETKDKSNECATCGCGDPNDTHGVPANGMPQDNGGHGTSEGTEKRKDWSLPQVKEPNFAYCVGCGEKMPDGSTPQHQTCNKCKGYKNGERLSSQLAEGKHKSGCQCGFCKNKGNFGKKKKEVEEPKKKENECVEDEEKTVEKQQRIDESYSAPFQRMRSLAGVGNTILMGNGLMETKHAPGADHPFNTHWKMDKEKAGFVKIDEDKLKQVKDTLERKSKRGSLSDKEMEAFKKLNEVLKRRASKP